MCHTKANTHAACRRGASSRKYNVYLCLCNMRLQTTGSPWYSSFSFPTQVVVFRTKSLCLGIVSMEMYFSYSWCQKMQRRSYCKTTCDLSPTFVLTLLFVCLLLFVRWIKFEEDVEGGGWGRPHISALTFHSLSALRKTLESGEPHVLC